GRIGATITDGAYKTMLAAILGDRTPNLLVINYAWPAWRIVDLLLIPKFAFTESSLIKRPPLALTARRAGWIGCNIDLRRIATDARIQVVSNGIAASPNEVREKYDRLKPLQNIAATQRGWTLDVLRIVRSIRQDEFSNADVYRYTSELEALHPNNRHIRDK